MSLKLTVSPVAKLSVPLSVSVTAVVARRRPDRHGGAGAEGDGAALIDGEAAGEEDRDAGGAVTVPPWLDREAAGEDVAEVGRGLGADGVQGQRLAAGDGVRLDVDALEPEVVVAGAGEVLDVDGGDVERRVEAVAARSPALNTTPSAR